MRVTVVGGGQLARMMQPPAIALGIRLRLLAEGPDVAAAQVIPDHLVGSHTDLDDLRRAAEGADVVTFDHEHVPPGHLAVLADEGHPCRPGPHALLFAQDKGDMRERLGELGVPCPRWAPVESLEDVEAFGLPCVLKATRGGYDGKGVWVVRARTAAAEAIDSGADLIAEELVEFRRELCAQVARRPGGEVVSYPVVESTQVNGVCSEVIAPAPGLDLALAAQAQQIAETIATELDVVGMLAVELFETTDGHVLVNELAMRPHNTGHWSIDGAVTSQFENHLRGVLDLPLGSTRPVAHWSVMVNILGGTVTDLEAQLARLDDPDVRVHLYGKAVVPGRKVGHVTVSGSDLEDVTARARAARDLFTNG